MLTLGLSAFGQNPAACLLRDGKLVAFVEEERLVRIKGAFGRFPGRAVSYCLEEAGVRFGDVDRIAVGWNAEKYRWRMPLFLFKNWLRHGRHAEGSAYGTIWKEIFDQQPWSIRHRLTLGLREAGHAGPLPAVEFVDHHLAHAASAFYASGFDDAAILVFDGSGEERSTSLYHGKGLDIVEKGHTDFPDSLGWFYAAITAYLGFRPYEEEGFTMGLAPYGRPSAEIEDKIAKVLSLGAEGSYGVDPSFTLLGRHEDSEHFSAALCERLGPPRLPGQPLEQRHKDVARAAQSSLEEAALQLVRRASGDGRLRRLCLAGGVALNCKMNGVLARSPWVDELFVQPAAHDSGTALGAALWTARQAGLDPRFHMDHACWGPSFGTGAIEKALQTAGVEYRARADAPEQAARAVAAGKIVAWHDGRMEVGPRALGGRSILASASTTGMNDRVNARVKFRDPWRPFCPSMTAAAAPRYVDGASETRFMTVAYSVPEARRSEIPAVIHVDGSTRPQTVTETSQPRYFRLIESVARESGVPVVLNTSLNVKGEPIACTPMDTLRCFFSSGIDILVLGDFWLEKK